MAAQTLKSATLSPVRTNHLTAVKGMEDYRQQVTHLSTLAWQVAYTSLWNTAHFSQQEINTAKQAVETFIQQQNNPVKAYSEFVQRVLLARYYLLSHPGMSAPLPSQWLNPANKKGFTGTEKWLTAIEETRSSLPLYKQVLKAFPEAVAETISSQKAADYHYWRSYFIQHNADGLLNLFLSVMANCTYTH